MYKQKVNNGVCILVIMDERQFINKMQEQNLGIITISAAARLIKKGRNYTALYLNRLENRKILRRIEKGKYALPNTHPLVIATNLTLPSYVSFLSGLAYYNKTTQIPRIIQVVTTRSKNRIIYENEEMQFIHLKRAFGYIKEKNQNGYVFIGEIEKIIIDSLFLPRCCPLTETIQAIDAKLNVEKLIDHALKMGSIVALKRLGFILELNDIDIYNKVSGYFNDRYDLFNPQLPAIGENNARWKLKINEVI